MQIDGIELAVGGRLIRTARVRAEYYEYVRTPGPFLEKLKRSGLRAHLFTFLQETHDRAPRPGFYSEIESIAVLPITTFEHWWKKELKDKTRNMIRKSAKAGIETRVVQFDDELVKGIVELYNECPLRQGKPFLHYGKSFETIQDDHKSYLDKSDFIGAFYGDELVGFAKLVHQDHVSNLMQIISKIAYRDKAPTNALISKAVEICAERNVPYLHYGLWSKRGLGDFKRHHRFQQFDIPRYFVPLNLFGRLVLALRLHRGVRGLVPERWEDSLVKLRGAWNGFRYRKLES